jgi:hypothetical protein
MKVFNVVVIVFVLSTLSFSQIDKTNWYPLQFGNKWQFSYYVSISESFLITIEVVGDTLINGKTFSKIKNNDKYLYQRLENNEKVWEYNTITNREYVRYDFIAPDKSIWNLDSVSKQFGVYETFPKRIQIYGDTLISKVFNNVYVRTSSTKPDTIWNSMVDGLAIVVTKGLGITEYGQGINQGSFVGAKINGYIIGVLTKVEVAPKLSDSIKLNHNYPNPFNPVTNISYSIPASSKVEITIYNSLGQKIKTLINAFQNRGEYEVQFNGSELSSGVYYYQLKTNDYYCVNKMLLIK